MAKPSQPPRPVATLLDLLEVRIELFRKLNAQLAASEPTPALLVVVERAKRDNARLLEGVKYWLKEGERAVRASQAVAVTLVLTGRTFRSDLLLPRAWERLLSGLLVNPTPRGLRRLMLCAFPLRRFRNWSLWAATTRRVDVTTVCTQLLGKGR